MLLERIQIEKLGMIRTNAGDKEGASVDAEKILDALFGKNYRIRLDHQILDDHGVFYSQALYNDLVFELTLAPAWQVVKGSDAAKLVYKLTGIQMEYKTILTKALADEATTVYYSGKAFASDYIMREEVVTFDKNKDSRLNIKVNPQRRGVKDILLLFIEPYNAGARNSEKCINHDITKVSVTVNGSPSKISRRRICGRRSAGHFSPKMLQAKWTSQSFTQTISFGCSSTFAVAFIGGNYLGHFLSGDDQRLPSKKK